MADEYQKHYNQLLREHNIESTTNATTTKRKQQNLLKQPKHKSNKSYKSNNKSNHANSFNSQFILATCYNHTSLPTLEGEQYVGALVANERLVSNLV
jgi:hypothetical protein